MTRAYLFQILVNPTFEDRYLLSSYQPQIDGCNGMRQEHISYDDQQTIQQTIKDKMPHDLHIA